MPELKPAKTFEEQIEILKERNMKIIDEKYSINILKKINYYRLTGYALQFKKNNNYGGNISFHHMYKLYEFDKNLRQLILNKLEEIEIPLRTYMAYELATKYGPEAYKKLEVYKDYDFYTGYEKDGELIKGLKDEINTEIKKNSKDLIVIHHKKYYDGKFPIWAIVELFSFGMLAKMYKNLKTVDQKAIAKECFKINNQLLESWLISLSKVRNTCAHYGRIYNKNLKTIPKLHRKYSKYNLDDTKIFIVILAMKELLIGIDKWEEMKEKVRLLIDEYKEFLDLTLIGFPENWNEILEL